MEAPSPKGNPVNCPFCNATIPEGFSSKYCPGCKKNMEAVDESPEKRLNGFAFIGFLLAPAISAFILAETGMMDVLGMVPLIASLIAGVYCGAAFAQRTAEGVGWKIAVFLASGIFLGFVSLLLSFGGCSLGGYQPRFH